MRLFITLVLYSISIISCAIGANWPHENFKAIYSGKIGESIDNPELLAGGYPKKKVGSRNLPNGNIETEYRMKNPWGVCRIYYEVNPATRIIVGWRYDGTTKACSNPP